MQARLGALAGLLLMLLAAPATADAAGLRAGVGKADITPKTGYYLGGWTRADRVAKGQHTRLFSRALVLERNGRKVALAQVDLFMVPGGMVKHIGDALRRRGFSEQNIVISASHTHSGPGGYANFPTFNTAAPSMQTIGDPSSFVGLFNPSPADPQLYTFLVNQIVTAIRRADDDRAPAAAGWGQTKLLGLTQNRSVEAHLANHGIVREQGQGSASLDPGGYEHTIDPAVNVLRVDKVTRRCRTVRVKRKRRARRKRARRRPAFTGQRRRTRRRCRPKRVPIGAWSTFADHGTVTKSTFQYYNQDHHGSAIAAFEYRVRRAAKVRRRQEVLNVYGNSNEGDMSAGLSRHGPAASDYVGRAEADAMFAAWRQARGRLTRNPALDVRWTRVCFCGQAVEGGQVADDAEVGLPFFTGSEEERGPLFDVTQEHFEGRRNPVAVGPHGHKLGVEGIPSSVPKAVPLLAVRVADSMIVTIPGEGTKEVGERARSAVRSAVAGSGIARVVVSGLANEFVLYFTTPEEHDRQHYEGGQTLFGRLSSVLIQQELAGLAGRLARGEPAQAAFQIDPTAGVRPNGPPYGAGASGGRALQQPARSYRRLRRASFSWQGGPEGLDRPVGRAFVVAQRRVGRGWRNAASDLGLQMLWTVDEQGRYRVQWEIPLYVPRGRYRLVVRAKRYALASREFTVEPTGALTLLRPRGGRLAVALRYPSPVRDVDLTHRQLNATGGTVRFRVGSRSATIRRRRAELFPVRAPAGVPVSVDGGAARDRYGNFAARGLRLRD